MRKTLVAAASVLALTGTTAFAQTATQGSDTRAQPGAATGAAGTGTTGMGATPAATPTTTTKRGTPVIARASRLIGGAVENREGDNIGKIRDMVIDPATGQIQQVVVGVGGFLGIGEKDVALQWDGLQIEQEVRELAPRGPAATGTPPAAPAPATRADAGTTPPAASTGTPAEPAVVTTGRPRIVVAMTKEQLEKAPEFRFDDEKAVSGGAASTSSTSSGTTGAGGTSGGSTAR